jgi:hypothetical protein
MEISILGLQQSLNIVECLLNSQPPCGIIRTTDDLFFLPYSAASMEIDQQNSLKWWYSQQKIGNMLRSPRKLMVFSGSQQMPKMHTIHTSIRFVL